MKIKYHLLLLSLFVQGICLAETPVTGSENTTVPYTGIVTPFSVMDQVPIPVNEGEVRAGLLYDAVNGKIVWQKNLTTPYPIASLTKLMVALLAVEDIRAGLFTWQEPVKWTREIVVGRGKHRKKISQQVSYSFRDVFKAAMIASNNECAEQLARHLGCGNLQETIDRMNSRARSLGMMNTYYGNPTGLPAPHFMFDNSSTPSDLLLLTMEMLKYDEILEIAAMGYANIENGKNTSVIRNHNHLTIDFSGEVDGLKTGYTKRAGFCLIATTAKCDHRLVSIVLGCRGPQIRNEVVRDMINFYYTSIALDPLGPSCTPSPLNPSEPAYAQHVSPNGKYVTITESVKKIHKVRSGETLSSVAKKYNCLPSQIKGWNKSKFTRSSRLIKGQSLAVYVNQSRSIYIEKPLNGNEADDDKILITEDEKKNIDKDEKDQEVNAPTIEKAAVNSSPKYLYYTVAPGDTLFNIAKRYQGTTVDELKTLNNIQDGRTLKPGTRLKVKVKGNL